MSREVADFVWQKIKNGDANQGEKISAIATAGKAGSGDKALLILALSEDADELVRYFALQALVLDLKQKDAPTEAVCWRHLCGDPSEDVRAMSAACLGSILFGTKRLDAFRRLKAAMITERESARVRRSIFAALFKLVGRPPSDWPGLPASENDAVDMGLVAKLEAECNRTVM